MANNQIKAEHGKCHQLLSTQETTCIQLECFTVKYVFFYRGKKRYCTRKTLLGININNKLKFHVHVGIIGQIPNRKLNALAKITNYMELLMHFLQYNLVIALVFGYFIAVL